MPEVVTKQNTILGTGVVTTSTQSQIVTKVEIETAINAIAKATAAGKMKYAADKARDAALTIVFEKMLGVKTLDEVKNLNEEQMANLLAQRTKDKAFSIEADFDIKLEGAKKAPAWKEGFIAKLGQAAANAFEAAARTSYTWHIIMKQKAAVK